MKLVYSLTLCFFLFVFITNLSVAFSSEDNEQVLDLRGNPVIAGNKYYIIGGSLGGGGLKLVETSNSNCGVTILHSDFPFEFGTPVRFTNLESGSEKILTSTRLGIEVTQKPECAYSSTWILFVDNIIHKTCVGIGGYENYNYFQTVSGTFSILKHGFGYKFRFCLEGSGACYDIGSHENSGENGKRLYFAEQEQEDPFEFVFLPASFGTGIIKSVVA